jgi:hypothetical protein
MCGRVYGRFGARFHALDVIPPMCTLGLNSEELNMQSRQTVRFRAAMALLAVIVGAAAAQECTPVLLSRLGSGERAGFVSRQGDLAAFTDWSALRILDYADPRAPVELSRMEWPGQEPTVVTMRDSLVFVATKLGGGKIVDVVDPARPRLVSEIGPEHCGGDLVVAGDVLYSMSNWPEGVSILDIADPFSPRPIGFIPMYAGSSLAIGRDSLLGTQGYRGVAIYDVGDPSNAERLGEIPPTGRDITDDVVAVGDIAYTACWGVGLQVHDISDPANPRLVGEVHWDDGGAHELEVVNHVAFVLGWIDHGSALLMFDLTDAASAVPVGRYDIEPGSGKMAWDLEVDYPKGLVLVTDSAGELLVLDISACVGACPADLTRDGSIDTRDVLEFLSAWAADEIVSDWDRNGRRAEVSDLIAYLQAWQRGC